MYQTFKNLGFNVDKKLNLDLRRYLGLRLTQLNVYNKFCSILLDTGSVVAGSLVLNAASPITQYGQEYICYHIYIYATYSGAVAINDYIKIELQDIISGSDQKLNFPSIRKDSIQRNNGVKAKITYSKKIEYSLSGSTEFVNLIIVDQDPHRFISTAPLSFNKILFDGEHVKAMYPEDIKNKSGHLNPEYIPLVNCQDYFCDLKIDKYEGRGFTINYDRNSDIIGRRELYGKPISEEEDFVFFIYNHLIHELIIPFYKKFDLGQHDLEKRDIMVSDMYLRWMYIEKYTMTDLLSMITKIAKVGKFILPLWIKDKYKKETDIIRVLLLSLVEGYVSRSFENLPESTLYYVLTTMGVSSRDELFDEIDKIDEIHTEYDQDLHPLERTKKIFENYLENIRYEKQMAKQDAMQKSKPNTRDIPMLNFVRTSRNPVEYNEKNRMIGKKCKFISQLASYDMSRYLEGKRVRGYRLEDDKKDSFYNLPAVSKKEAMKRLIFFVAKSDKLDDLTPFCYNLDFLTEDIGARLYVECKDFENQDGLTELFSQNPIIRIDLDFPIYLPLGELLDAIYNTQNQVFILIPTNTYLKYTASMTMQFKPVTSQSGHHCQEGSKKQLHTIRVCKGKACWPINQKIEINEIYPDSNYMKQKFYALSKSEVDINTYYEDADDAYNIKDRTPESSDDEDISSLHREVARNLASLIEPTDTEDEDASDTEDRRSPRRALFEEDTSSTSPTRRTLFEEEDSDASPIRPTLFEEEDSDASPTRRTLFQEDTSSRSPPRHTLFQQDDYVTPPQRRILFEEEASDTSSPPRSTLFEEEASDTSPPRSTLFEEDTPRTPDMPIRVHVPRRHVFSEEDDEW